MTLDCLCDGHVQLSLLTGAAKLRRSTHNGYVLCFLNIYDVLYSMCLYWDVVS